MTLDSVTANAKATSIYNEAREEKRLSRRHATRARTLMRKLAEFEARCAKLGIRVSYKNTDSQGGDSVGSNADAA